MTITGRIPGRDRPGASRFAEMNMKNVKDTVTRKERPVKVVQFGEGNFLRAFADLMIDEANEKGVFDGNIVLVKPIEYGTLDRFREQDCFYTVLRRGRERGEVVNVPRVVTSVCRAVCSVEEYRDFMDLAGEPELSVIISNTTEAGIVFDGADRFDAEPPATYPGKLTKFLFERFTRFTGSPSRGVMILPVELIEDNGKKLKDCVTKLADLWGLPVDFKKWLDTACLFTSTLVDRIVTGYPKGEGEAEKIWEELGYRDRLLDICEPFGLWVIETDDIPRAKSILDLEAAGMPVIYTDNMKPYRERKVRILNGAHTSFVPAAFLAGHDIVRECMNDPVVRPFIDAAVYREIAPCVDLPADEVKRFADSVCERFDNPFIDHALISISLNSVSKWRARVLPSLKDFVSARGITPPCLTMSFAALCDFYSRGVKTEDGFFGERGAGKYEIRDDSAVIDFFARFGKEEDVVLRFARNTDFWGEDLTKIGNFGQGVYLWHKVFTVDGPEAALKYAVKMNADF